ncbi:tellurium resistance protein TerW (plasmid) [Pantoea sp. C3]|uniref:tellurium resistance protein TerW n=1 Tax=Pantoea phytostimulans TaxID=2769024 RepID=UPI0038F6D54E
MSLSAKQYRQFKLIVLLHTGKPVGKETLIKELDCSEPTFNRDLRNLRDEYKAEVRFLKSTNKYQLTTLGDITPKVVRYTREALAVYEKSAPIGSTSSVILDKEAKKPVSLSLRLSVIRKIESYGNKEGMNRSQVVEWLVDNYLARCLGAAKTKK